MSDKKQQGIDWGSVDGSAQDYQDIFPRIQWMHGSKQAKNIGGMSHTGGFFIPEDQFTDFEAPGFEETVFVANDNSEIKGWYSKGARLSVIRMKWFWTNNTSYCHMLCLIKGEKTKSLFSYQTKGVTKAMYARNSFNDHRSRVVSLVNRSRPESAPMIEPFGLWFCSKAGEHDIYTSKTGEQSGMTPPELFIPEGGITLDYAMSLYIGKELYKEALIHFKDTEAWQDQIPKQSTDSTSDDYVPISKNPIPDEPEEFEKYEEPASEGKITDDDIPF